MYDTKQRPYWHSSNRHSAEAPDRPSPTWHLIHPSISLLHLVRPHVNERMTIQLRRSVQSIERARNKSITRDRSDEYHTSRSRSLIQKLPTDSLHHLPPDLQSRPHLTVNDIYRMFLEKPRPMSLQQHQMRACSSRSSDKCSPKSSDRIQTHVTSYLNATASPAFETAKFEVFRPTHARGNLPRQFSISILATSPFSILGTLQLSPVLEHRQGHSVTRWPDSWIISNASRVENEWRSLLWGRLTWRSLKSSLFSDLSLVTLLSWRSHYFEGVLECVVLFCFYSPRPPYHSFGEGIRLLPLRSLACCCFARPPPY